MSITFTSTGGLFTRLGAIIAAARTTLGHIGVTAAVGDANDTAADWGVAGGPKVKQLGLAISDIEAQFLSADQSVVDGIISAREAYRSSHSQYLRYLQGVFSDTIITQVSRDMRPPVRDIRTAVVELIRQMNLTVAQTVKANTIAATPAAAATNTGSGLAVCGVLGRDGATLEYCLPETIRVTINNDSGRGATAGSEAWTAKGTIAAPNSLDYLWPMGSAATVSGTVVNPAASSNMLANGTFETWTVTNVPDNWPKVVGVTGTSIKRDTSHTYNGSGAALEIVGDGAELTEVAQDITAKVLPNTVYLFRGWARVSATPSTGIMKAALTDDSDAIINDDAGGENSATITLTGLSTSYVAFSGSFRTPKVLPDAVKFSLRVTTAIESGKSAYIDWLAMAPASGTKQLYTGGPYLAVFRGDVDFAAGDYINVPVTNNLAGTNAVGGGGFQTWFDRMLGMRAMGLQIPSSGSNTINENLIT